MSLSQVMPALWATGALMSPAFGVSGTIGICFGAAIAAIADQFPAQRTRLQYCGGSLLIGGITLVALAMPML
jgi:hypothetical protein